MFSGKNIKKLASQHFSSFFENESIMVTSAFFRPFFQTRLGLWQNGQS